MRVSDDFPIAFLRFVATLATEDKVWITHMRMLHGTEKHRPSEWQAILDKMKRS